MKKWTYGVALLSACSFISVALVRAQGRGGAAEWTTAHGDAQRSSWVRSDMKVSAASMQKGGFQFLWKLQFRDNEPRQLNSLTQPVLLNRLVGFRGFKAIAVVGASSDAMYAVDYDLGTRLWTTFLNYSADLAIPPTSWECPGGLAAAATRPTASVPSAFAAAGGGRGGRSGGSVGEPGRGAPNLAVAGRGRGTPPPPAPGAGTAPAAQAPGFGGGGGGRGGPMIMGQTDAFYAMGSDGYVHALNVSNGADLFPPVKFIPENSKPAALLLVNGVLYTGTSNGCGATPNGVWAIDLTNGEKKTVVWKTDGGSIVGSAGPTLGTEGTIYAAVGAGTGGYSSSVVALEPRTLKLKDWLTVPNADFNASPSVFQYKDRDLIAVTANDGRMYLLDGSSLGGADHKTPLYVTPKYSASISAGALSTWEAPSTPAAPGTRWILAPAAGRPVPSGVKFAANGSLTNGGIVAFRLVEQNGRMSLEPGWSSRDMTSPLPPVVVNNVVFAVSSGEYRGPGAPQQAAQRAVPAVLYALDGDTGKELWNSGKTITSFARSGLAAGGTNGSQVFVVTYDSTLYAFGFPIEK